MIERYELESIVGRGGTAAVWRARDRRTGATVALKVLTVGYASEPQFREFLANEVRVVARLNHPNIAALVDAGEVDRADEAHGIVAGSPFLAMEYVPHGTLDEVISGLDYRAIRSLLLSLMDALAHAHSHGVVHLDLKPGNVLLRSAQAPYSLALTDFGVSRFEDAALFEDSSDEVKGTPTYMAPEQIEGKVRETGPWTDLYALGCMAYEMVAGYVPFNGDTNFHILTAHLEQPVPPFVPRTPVPREFLKWLGRLLEKDPRRRFQRAAHAAMALRQIRERDLVGSHEDDPSGTMELQSIRKGKSRQVYWPSVPLPTSWRGRTPASYASPVIGAELIRHRIPMVVGAEAERDTIWSTFLESIDDGLRVVALSGPGGVGRTRIAEWAGRFIDEIGAAVAIVARYRAGHGGERALENALARRFGVQGLAPAEALPVLRDLLAAGGDGIDEGDLLDAVLLSDMLSVESGRSLPSDERRAVLGRCLERIASHFPLVLVLDDLHESPEDQRLVSFLTERHASAKILIVATSRDDGIAESVRAASRLTMSPLPDANVQKIIRQLVPLDPETLERLVDEAHGLPGNAVRLVTSWADRGLLEPSSRGFRIGERARGESVGEAAERRVLALLGQFTGDERRALQAAAALAPAIMVRDWLAVMRYLGMSVGPDFLERAVRLGVLEREQEDRLNYVFSTPDIWRTLDAEVTGHAREILHLACADELERIHGPLRRPALMERVARHLAEASRHDDALALVGRAALRQHQYDAVVEARRLLDLHAALLTRASEDARRVERWVGEVVRFWLDERDGSDVDPNEVYELQSRAFQVGALGAAAEAARLRAKLLRRRSFEAATEALEEAAERLLEAGRTVGLGTFWLGIGWNRGMQGEFDVAFSHLERALRVFTDEHDFHWIAQTWRAIAYFRIQQGDYGLAKDALDVSVNIARDYGDRQNLGGSYLYMGELERAKGNYRRASKHYSLALDAYANDGSSNVAVARYNLALCELAFGRYGMARGMLENLHKSGMATSAKIDEYVGIALGPIYAESGEWAKWDELFVPAARQVRRKLHAENDFARLTELAGDLARSAGQLDRARFAWSISRDLWGLVGRREESARIDALLAEISP